jgi:UPF0176 protein
LLLTQHFSYSKGTHMTIRVAAFYRFISLPQFRDLQEPMMRALRNAGAKGSVLLAEEGFNGTVAAPADKIPAVIEALSKVTGCADFDVKYSATTEMPFKRLKVKLKKEIVTIGTVAANPNEKVGQYVEPENWNALISDPDVVLIDTRNDYEVKIGTFKGAIDPQTTTFGQFPAYVREKLDANKNARVAMFCTGGIRCEKASSFMINEGYENVYHLKGGILKYLEVMPREGSLWEGACFVFDERVAVGHGLEITGHKMCHGCLEPIMPEDLTSPLYEEGVACPKCADRLTDAQKASGRERQKQFELAKKRGTKHLGPWEE